MNRRGVVLLGLALPAAAASLSSYHIGNSIIDQFDGIPTIASSKGDQLTSQRKSIPGAGIGYNYDNGGIPSALSGGRWDIVMPLSFQNGSQLGVNNDARYCGYYYDAGLRNNANCRLVLFVQWPENSSSYATQWLRTLNVNDPGYAQPYGSKAFHEALLAKIRSAYPGKAVDLVPVGHCLYEFDKRARAGSLPGFSSAGNLYADGIHLNSQGKYLQNICGYAVFFKKDPHGAGLSFAQWSGTESVSQSFATMAADVVWDVVRQFSTLTGVPGGTGVTVVPAPLAPAASSAPEGTLVGINGVLTGGRADWHASGVLIDPRNGKRGAHQSLRRWHWK